ncbi:MAG: hypothetical protein KDA32_11735 [Phycisphaerales bacterium]|nr:hypothetical protein [Phycisphaerales bacterium]
MIEFVPPQPLINPFITPPPPDPGPLEGLRQAMLGPVGVLAFVPLAPLTRWLARRDKRAALLVLPIVWWLATVGPTLAGLMLWGGVALAAAWIGMLSALRRRNRLSQRGMVTLVWVGLHALVLPLWWFPHPFWFPGMLAPLHALGIAYFLLRLVDWGVSVARDPAQPSRPLDTLLWLLYPPCARLGPVMTREEFLIEFDDWNPATPTPWRAMLKRFGYLVVGCVAIGVCVHNFPKPKPDGVNFFDTPEHYTTDQLTSVLLLVPMLAYLALWIYNELAAFVALWVGLPVRNNFNWLPTSCDIRDFWRRWHVTVGDWMDKHIFKPLGGHRRRTPLNYAIVFGYSALWHGASLSFLLWGFSQTVAINIQRRWDLWRKRTGRRNWPNNPVWTATAWLITMSIAATTMVVFADFQHCGGRYFPELFRRLISGT